MYLDIPDYRYRLIDYVGDGILIGCTLGPPFYLVKGIYNSPSGGRLASGAHAVRANVPRFAGMIAGRLAMFSALESGMSLARGRREDELNTIVAGTGTYGLVYLHRGVPAAARATLLAAAFFVGMAFLEFSTDDWHSRLVRSGREIRMQDFWLPALVPIRRDSPCRAALGDAAGGSVEENRSGNDAKQDFFAMELKPEMTSKDG